MSSTSSFPGYPTWMRGNFGLARNYLASMLDFIEMQMSKVNREKGLTLSVIVEQTHGNMVDCKRGSQCSCLRGVGVGEMLIREIQSKF